MKKVFLILVLLMLIASITGCSDYKIIIDERIDDVLIEEDADKIIVRAPIYGTLTINENVNVEEISVVANINKIKIMGNVENIVVINKDAVINELVIEDVNNIKLQTKSIYNEKTTNIVVVVVIVLFIFVFFSIAK